MAGSGQDRGDVVATSWPNRGLIVATENTDREHVEHVEHIAPTEHAARAFEDYEVAAMAWQSLSRFPRERGIAATRFRAYVREGLLEPDLLLAALCELATQGYSARAFNRQVARDRIARIREEMYAYEKGILASQETGFGNLARQMRDAGLPLGIFESFLR